MRIIGLTPRLLRRSSSLWLQHRRQRPRGPGCSVLGVLPASSQQQPHVLQPKSTCVLCLRLSGFSSSFKVHTPADGVVWYQSFV
eukprot:419250-Hanusia_phi.AAC.1